MLVTLTDTDERRPGAGTRRSPDAGAVDQPVSKSPKYAVLRDRLTDQIVSGQIRCGDKLPSETALGDRFQVSRVTVRHALDALREAGLVESRQGRGHFVRRIKVGFEVDRLRGLGEIVAPAGIRIAAKVLSSKEVNGKPKLRKDLDLDRGERLVRVVRLRRIGARPVCLETRFIRQHPGRQLLQMDLTDADMYRLYEREAGLDLGYAEVTVDHVGATATAARLLRVDELSVLMRMRHLVFEAGARPLELCERLCLPKAFMLTARAGR